MARNPFPWSEWNTETRIIDGMVFQPQFQSEGSGENYSQGPVYQVLKYPQGKTAPGEPYEILDPQTGMRIGQGAFQRTGNVWDLTKTAAADLAPILAFTPLAPIVQAANVASAVQRGDVGSLLQTAALYAAGQTIFAAPAPAVPAFEAPADFMDYGWGEVVAPAPVPSIAPPPYVEPAPIWIEPAPAPPTVFEWAEVAPPAAAVVVEPAPVYVEPGPIWIEPAPTAPVMVEPVSVPEVATADIQAPPIQSIPAIAQEVTPMPDWFDFADYGFGQDVPAPVSIPEFSAPDFMDYGYGMQSAVPSANVAVQDFAAPDWMDYGYGTAETMVEPPPVSFGGEEPVPMDIPPYVYAMPEMPPIPVPEVTIAPTAPIAPTSPLQSVDQIIKTVSGAAMSAISLVRAWETRKLPPNPVAQARRPDGATVTARSDGTVITRTTDGRTTVTRPEVGLPQSTVDGFVVVNNGDGTYTRIDPNGNAQTLRYAAPSTGGGTGAGGITIHGIGEVSYGVLIAGIGAVALLAYSQRKR